ncbi:MAG: hypothetical protein Q7Q71_10150 [Verrucomicrobiota bacterium JB023]|nr:hypothetical protein [Verrucomicrobiota bacterium JB023]
MTRWSLVPDILIAASTNADLPSGVSSIANINRNGHILKIDGETGAPLWSTLIGSGASIQYSSINEGPDGTVYVGGQASPNVRSDLPSMVLTKLTPDGSLIDTALIGTVSGQSLPYGGKSFNDNIRGMSWADGNLWICGQSGIYNAGGVGGVAQGSTSPTIFFAMMSPATPPPSMTPETGSSSNCRQRTPSNSFNSNSQIE